MKRKNVDTTTKKYWEAIKNCVLENDGVVDRCVLFCDMQEVMDEDEFFNMIEWAEEQGLLQLSDDEEFYSLVQ